MTADFIQFVLSGLTAGSTYALAALGFMLVYNASGVINFAQGEYIMIGGTVAAALYAAGLPLAVAAAIAIAVAVVCGLLTYAIAIHPARNASVVTLIIITLGVSLILRGLAQIVFGKGVLSLPPFSGETPIQIAGATVLPQSLWIFGVSGLLVALLAGFFAFSKYGKAILAVAYNRLAAQLVGISPSATLLAGFVLAAVLGSVGGTLVTPLTYTSYDAGILLGLKGFVAATLGGLGSGLSAVLGGLLLGLLEALTAGYLSSAYKDATAFVLVLLVLFVRPRGLFGAASSERV